MRTQHVAGFAVGVLEVKEAIEQTNQAVAQYSTPPPLRVLDIGCGDRLRVRIPEPFHLVGIDISPEQLERNIIAHEKILGDIETYPLEANSFDVIVCFDVLEHVPRPERVLVNCAHALKPGGLLVIAVPNPASIKGLLTKCSPHWFHVLAHRYLLGNKNAGKPGHPPFPTTMRWALTPRNLITLCDSLGFEPVFLALMESSQAQLMRRNNRLAAAVYFAAIALFRVLTFGRYDGGLADFRAVFRKRR